MHSEGECYVCVFTRFEFGNVFCHVGSAAGVEGDFGCLSLVDTIVAYNCSDIVVFAGFSRGIAGEFRQVEIFVERRAYAQIVDEYELE